MKKGSLKLNHQQMAAWLTLEGWEYRPGNTHWFDSLTKGDRRVLYDRDMSIVEEEPWRSGKVDGPYPFQKAQPLSEIPAQVLMEFYNYLQEKQND